MTDANRTGLAYVAETVWGTTPATPTLKALRFTGESLAASTEFISSNEIRDDRQVSDVVRTNFGASGDINIELSYGAFDDLLEALLFGTWTTNVLGNGVLAKSFTVEKQFLGATEFIQYRGMMLAGGSVNVEPGSIVTGNFSFLGKGVTATQASVASAAPTAAPTNSVVNAIDNISLITEGGSTYTGDVLGLSFEVQNNLRARPAVGVLGASSIGVGRIQVSGSFNTYFSSSTEYAKFLAATASSLSFEVTDAATNKYLIQFPRIRYTNGNPFASGVDTDVVLPLEFTAFMDPGTQETIRITRTPA
jgi:hypothetical protein